MKNFSLRMSSVNVTKSSENYGLVTFTEKALNGTHYTMALVASLISQINIQVVKV